MTTILILGSAPPGLLDPRLEDERRRLEQALEGTPFMPAHSFDFDATQLSELLRRHTPEIVHFIGHGSRDGELIVRGEASGAAVIDADAFAGMLGNFSEFVRCVFLNACFTNMQAEQLARKIEVVVAASGELDAEAGLLAATSFYRTLASGESVQRAYAIALRETPLRGQIAPQLTLRTRDGVNPDEVFIPSGPEPDPRLALIAALTKLLHEWFTLDMLKRDLRRIGMGSELNLEAAHLRIAEEAAILMVTGGRRFGASWFDWHINDAREYRDFARMRAFKHVKRLWIHSHR